VTLKSLIAATALAENRVKVVVALLDATGIIERGRRIKKLREFGSDEELATFLAEYEQRHSTDRERLDSMMKYGQITECRMRYLTRYFGDEIATDCGHCDNCRAKITTKTVDVDAVLRGKATGL